MYLCAIALMTNGCSCNGNGRVAQQLAFTLDYLQPLASFQVGAGQVVIIRYQDDDPADLAKTSIYADGDGDPATTNDQIVIALDRPEGDGAAQDVPWDTTGVPPGDYRIIAVMTDGQTTLIFEAPGRATVMPPNVAPTLLMTGPDQPLTLSRGACVPVSYVDDDPDDVASSSFVADVDGDLSTTGDSTDIALNRPEMDGQSQSFFWNSRGSPEGSYFIGGTTSDGINTPASDVAVGSVTLENVAYAKRAGGTPFQQGSAVAAFADGSCVVTGDYDTFFAPVTFGPGEPDAVTYDTGTGTFVARYGSDGTLDWVRRTEGGTPRGIASFSDGSCVVTGGFFGTLTVEPGKADEVVFTSSGGQDLFLARYLADGSMDWALRVGGGDPDQGYDVASMADGSCMVAGYYRNSVTFGAGEANETTLSRTLSNSIFVARYNPDGTLRWVRDGLLTNLAGFAAIPDGSYAILTGGGSISRFNADGSSAWTRTVAGLRAFAISAFADGSLAVGGSFSASIVFGAGEANETPLDPVGQADLCVARYEPDGALAWARSAGGALATLDVTSIASMPDGACVLGGSFAGRATFGAGEANETELLSAPFFFNPSSPSQDLFVARYDADGTLGFARASGAGTGDVTNSVAVFPDCSFVATGLFSGTVVFGEGDVNEATLVDPVGVDGVDMFVARYNADGGH
jgi:hypothetical protein